MAYNIFMPIIYLFFPALAMWLAHKYTFFNKIGALLICFVGGLLVGNILPIPEYHFAMRDYFVNLTVPLSIPLVLLSTDFIQWIKKSGAKSILSYFLAAAGVILSAFVAVLLLRSFLPEAWKMAGMEIGGFTGATINFMAVGVATQISEDVLVMMGAAMLPVELPWMIFMVTIAKRVIGKFLLPYTDNDKVAHSPGDEGAAAQKDKTEWNNLLEMISKGKISKTATSFLLTIALFVISYLIASLFPEEYLATVVIVSVSILGIVISFFPKLRKLDPAFNLGIYILMIFAFSIATQADLRALAEPNMLYIILFGVIVLYLGFFLHVLFCKLFKIDVDTMLITNAGAVFSPAYVPVVAGAIKNQKVVISGITSGLLGYATGNLLGIAFAYLFKALLM